MSVEIGRRQLEGSRELRYMPELADTDQGRGQVYAVI